MATKRQSHKASVTGALAGALLLLSTLAAAAQGLVPRFVTDPLTGVALGGYDPVSYFTEPYPELGSPGNEYDWGGVPWYFANPANRDVFMRAPEVYAPQFGGHSVSSLARGYLSDGNPQIYIVAADRLYLFYSTANREDFTRSPGEAIRSARLHWESLSRQFSAEPATPAAGLAGSGG